MKVETTTSADYLELIAVWESSIRATHSFLSEEDIAFLKPLILEQYLDAVDLRIVKDEFDNVIGFIGVAEQNVEMLFVSAEHRHKGIGALLLKNAIRNQAAKKVDVNEQNPDAVGFYKALGFDVIARSPLDGQGKPFPLLHMQLT